MSFEEYVATNGALMGGAKHVAQCAWDAAICAATAAMFERGRMVDKDTAFDRIRRLHTWPEPETGGTPALLEKISE